MEKFTDWLQTNHPEHNEGFLRNAAVTAMLGTGAMGAVNAGVQTYHDINNGTNKSPIPTAVRAGKKVKDFYQYVKDKANQPPETEKLDTAG